MTTWQGAMTLLRSEGRRSWGGLIFTFVFFTYVAVVMMPVFQDMWEKGTASRFGWLGDFLYLTILPNMAFVMNRNMMHYWSRDPFSRKLAYWRTLPISWNAIVLSRMVQHVVVLTVVAAYFFTLQYAVMSGVRELLSPGAYALYALTWYGYAMAAGATYVFFEQTLHGKVYFAVCLSYVAVYVLVGIVLWLTHTSLMFASIEAARDHRAVWPAVALLAGALATCLVARLARRQLAKRNLLL
ncbi:hypothetical protein I8J29_26030 [Paenibacillus sp. MWE-103]|uniref:ABC-2 type transport system permease protein n=1 Tax=Paenibacillus artemisiicola TaxID=1172618 RepID=A0ABS3WH66_9BACL|nr:hypothetical protein [Paenibacillus artemisiicola]MBO7747651.1 hypothetical protein [Paenibacillus artemisiicola]